MSPFLLMDLFLSPYTFTNTYIILYQILFNICISTLPVSVEMGLEGFQHPAGISVGNAFIN